jgi:DNA polymerase-3 subunit delta
MASGSDRAFRTAIKNGAFAPAYYLYGDDDYLKHEALRDAVDAAIDPATRDFNLEMLRAGDLSGEALGSILGTPPMMADRRVVVLRDANLLKKDARVALDRYLERPAADVLLLLVTPSGVKVDKTLASLATPVEFEPLTGDRIPAWISYYAKETLRTTISARAVTHLQEAAGTDIAQLKTELDKLASFAGDREIDETAVEAVVGVRPGETMGALLDAVARRDARAAMSLVPGVLQQPKTSGVQMVMALAVQTLALGYARASRERSGGGRLRDDLFGLLKQSGGAFVGRAWGEAITSWVGAVDRWSAADIDMALDALYDADVALKDSRVSSEEQMLTSLVLTLCGTGGTRRVA